MFYDQLIEGRHLLLMTDRSLLAMGIQSIEVRHAIVLSISKYLEMEKESLPSSNPQENVTDVSESDNTISSQCKLEIGDNPDKWDTLEVTFFLSQIGMSQHSDVCASLYFVIVHTHSNLLIPSTYFLNHSQIETY